MVQTTKELEEQDIVNLGYPAANDLVGFNGFASRLNALEAEENAAAVSAASSAATAVTAKNTTETLKDEAQTARDQAISAKDSAINAKNDTISGLVAKASQAALDSLSATVGQNETTNTNFRIAQASTNSSVASAIALTQAQIETPTTGLLARATSLEARTAAVEIGKASQTALDTLSATVGGYEATNSTFRAAQSVTNTNLQSGINARVATVTYSADQSAYGAWKSGIDSFKTTQLELNTNLQGAINGKASALTVDGINTRLGNAEGSITSINSSISTINSELGNKVNVTTYNALAATVGANEATNSAFRTAQAAENGSVSTSLSKLQAKAVLLDASNSNPDFDIYPTATGAPTDFSAWFNTNNATRIDDGNGGYDVLMPAAAGANAGFKQTINIPPGSYAVITAKVKLISGSFKGSGLHWSSNLDSYGFLSFYSYQNPINGQIVGDGIVGQEYIFSALYKNTSNVNPIIVMYLASHFSGMTGNSDISQANSIQWKRFSWRPANLAELQANRALLTDIPNLTASVATSQAAIATIEGAAAYYNLEVAASGSSPALMSAKAGKNGSSFDFISKVFRIWNQTSNGIIEVLKAVGGYVFFSNPISIDVGTKRLTLGANAAHVLWFGANSLLPPDQTIANSIFCLGTDGKVYFGASEIAALSAHLVISNTGVDTKSHNTAKTESATMGLAVEGGTAPYSYAWTLVHSQGDVSNGDPTLTGADTANVNISRFVQAAENASFSLQCVITDSSLPPKQAARTRRMKFVSTV